jgi:hypothetical protein
VQPALDAAARSELADFFRAMQRRLKRGHDRLQLITMIFYAGSR